MKRSTIPLAMGRLGNGLVGLIGKNTEFAVAYRLQPSLAPASYYPAFMARLISVLFALAVLAAPITAGAQVRGRGARFAAPVATGRGYQEPAFARGYTDGFRHAQEDRRERRRYEPVTHRDYRDADQGYSPSYGTLEAYRNNYRAGFRAGYDGGYRDSGRDRVGVR